MKERERLTYNHLTTVVVHSCPVRVNHEQNTGYKYNWSGLSLEVKDKCLYCGGIIPPKILGMHRLNNWDILYG